MTDTTDTTEATVTEADRIAALEAHLAKLSDGLSAEQGNKERERAAIEAQTLPSAPRVHPDSYNGEMIRLQDDERAQRAEAHATWAAAYDEQLERVAPDLEILERQRGELEERIAELEASHAAAVAHLRAEQRELREECAELMKPPPMPAVTGNVEVRIHALGGGYSRAEPQAARPRRQHIVATPQPAAVGERS